MLLRRNPNYALWLVIYEFFPSAMNSMINDSPCAVLKNGQKCLLVSISSDKRSNFEFLDNVSENYQDTHLM